MARKYITCFICICCALFWNLPHFKMVLYHFGIPKLGTQFEMVLHHFGTPSLAPFQNGAAPFWNINIFNIKVYLHKFSKFRIKFFFYMNDMIYLYCDKTWKLPSFKIRQAKLRITHIARLFCPTLEFCCYSIQQICIIKYHESKRIPSLGKANLKIGLPNHKIRQNG